MIKTLFKHCLVVLLLSVSVLGNGLLETCHSSIDISQDEQAAKDIISKIATQIGTDPEYKITLKDGPAQLESTKQKLLKCSESLLKKSYFKALQQMIDNVLEPLGIDISDDIKMIGNSIKKQIDFVTNYAASKKNIQEVTPAFLWAQSKNHIFLRVKFAHRHDAPGCLDISNEKIQFTNDTMHFSAFGIQAHSPINFLLDINFNDAIVPEESYWSLESVGRMFLNITKAEPRIWLNLLKEGEKNSKMKIWWDMKDQYPNDMDEFSKLLEAEEERKQEDVWKKKKKSKKQQQKEEEQLAKQKQNEKQSGADQAEVVKCFVLLLIACILLL